MLAWPLNSKIWHILCDRSMNYDTNIQVFNKLKERLMEFLCKSSFQQYRLGSRFLQRTLNSSLLCYASWNPEYFYHFLIISNLKHIYTVLQYVAVERLLDLLSIFWERWSCTRFNSWFWSKQVNIASSPLFDIGINCRTNLLAKCFHFPFSISAIFFKIFIHIVS